MAVFLGPRQIMAEVRLGRRKAREMQVRGPMGGRVAVEVVVDGAEVEVGGGERGCTGTGIQPSGAWVTVADSRLRRCGMEGPVRSMSRMPTECEAWVRARASCVVTEDLPTPPLPERICGGGGLVGVGELGWVSWGGGSWCGEGGGAYQDDMFDAVERHCD